MLHLPDRFNETLAPLFDALPLDEAMDTLVGEPDGDAHLAMVERLVASPAVADRPDLIAGLWLYVDQLDRSHAASQSLETPTGSYWHGIMHRREGDFGNSHYWFRRTGRHPAMAHVELAGGGAAAGTGVGGYDPHVLIDSVSAAHTRGDADAEHHPELVALQRREWAALFQWCVEQP